MPPPTNFPPVRYERRIPNTGPSGRAIFGISALVMGYGFYLVRAATFVHCLHSYGMGLQVCLELRRETRVRVVSTGGSGEPQAPRPQGGEAGGTRHAAAAAAGGGGPQVRFPLALPWFGSHTRAISPAVAPSHWAVRCEHGQTRLSGDGGRRSRSASWTPDRKLVQYGSAHS
jgi:hypothetical protein